MDERGQAAGDQLRDVAAAAEGADSWAALTRHVVAMLGFVPWQDIYPISYSRPYHVGPGGPAADRPYVLLVEALARTGQVGVCKVAVRSRERIALLRPRHGMLRGLLRVAALRRASAVVSRSVRMRAVPGGRHPGGRSRSGARARWALTGFAGDSYAHSPRNVTLRRMSQGAVAATTIAASTWDRWGLRLDMQ
ncbi:Ku protein [Streptomyces sp. NPDC005356]|uniref:Ku protein n=1 Tax=unclassified Streptomyces TaxID=2593676 RepID=UPI0033B7C250